MDDTLPPQEPPINPPPPPVTPPPTTPPPVTPPPVITAPPRPVAPARKGGRIWMIIAIIALVLLVLSVFSNLKNLAGGMTASSSSHELDRHLEEVVVERRNTDNKIAIIEVEGVISSRDVERKGVDMVESISDQLKVAAKDSDVKAVVLKVNSPGGEVLASDEINAAITKYQTKTGRPVVASMGALAASGGYYVSAPCRWIVANELTITGSIGVIMHGYNYRGLMNKIGIRPDIFKSGKFKDMLSGEKEPDPEKLTSEEREEVAEEHKMVQALIDETFDKFKQVVQTGREQASKQNAGKGKDLADDWRDYADGRVFSGRQALELGFVDELGNFEKAVERAQKLAGISKANLIQYRHPFDLGLLFRMLGKTETPTVKIDIGLDSPKLQAGHLYYITPTVLH